jgi:hypothetical protein
VFVGGEGWGNTMLGEMKLCSVERVEQGGWPTKVEVSDVVQLGFPFSKAHYKVQVRATKSIKNSPAKHATL